MVAENRRQSWMEGYSRNLLAFHDSRDLTLPKVQFLHPQSVELGPTSCLEDGDQKNVVLRREPPRAALDDMVTLLRP